LALHDPPLELPIVDTEKGFVVKPWVEWFVENRDQINNAESDLEVDLTQIEADIAALEAEVNTLQAEMILVQVDITTIEGNVTTLQADVLDNSALAFYFASNF